LNLYKIILVKNFTYKPQENLYQDIKKIIEKVNKRKRFNLGHILKRNKNIIKKKDEELKNYKGTLMEIYNRQPCSVQAYHWGTIKDFYLDNKIPANSLIKKDIQDYIFIPKKIENNGEITLIGTIQKYNVQDNKLDDGLENKIKIILNEFLKEKTLLLIGTF
jgi:hypothetical protein